MRIYRNGVLALSLAGCLIAAPAHSESYLCVAEAAGGIKFLEGKWKGTSFKTEEKYLVSRSSENNKQFTVTEIGKSYALHRCDVRLLPDGSESPQLVCGGLGYGMIINLSDLRYTEVYTLGYIENDKSGENTPSITGGLCSKIG